MCLAHGLCWGGNNEGGEESKGSCWRGKAVCVCVCVCHHCCTEQRACLPEEQCSLPHRVLQCECIFAYFRTNSL